MTGPDKTQPPKVYGEKVIGWRSELQTEPKGQKERMPIAYGVAVEAELSVPGRGQILHTRLGLAAEDNGLFGKPSRGENEQQWEE